MLTLPSLLRLCNHSSSSELTRCCKRTSSIRLETSASAGGFTPLVMQLGKQGLVVVVRNLGRGDANAGTEARLNKRKNEDALSPVRLDLLLRQAVRLEKRSASRRLFRSGNGRIRE